jgi:hypothetical protein
VETIDDKAIEPPLWREHDIALLDSACDAEGRQLKIVYVLAPRKRYWKGDPDSFCTVLSRRLCHQQRCDWPTVQ